MNRNKCNELRDLMIKNGLDAYIIPRADEYLGEFVAPSAERLAYLTGFTGSAGCAVVTRDQAVVMSDGRYTLQLAQQLDPLMFTGADLTKYPLADWLYDHIDAGQVVGFDPALHSIDQIEQLQKRMATKGIELKKVEQNLVDQLWPNSPTLPAGKVFSINLNIAGASSAEKIAQICGILVHENADCALIAQPDSIAWLLNIRGGDIDYTPVPHGLALVDSAAQTVDLFIALEKVPAEFTGAQIHPPESLMPYLQRLSGKTIALDFLQTPYRYKTIAEDSGAIIKNIKDPCIALKARKNAAEQAAIRAAHLIDGIAVTRCLAWLSHVTPHDRITEIDVSEKLESLRRANPAYQQPSFPTIAGFGANGAVIHYRATPQTNRAMDTDGLLLLDSGGQYLGDDFAGTTDITRTIAIGDPEEGMKRHFTLVLKGHIALAMAQFPAGTTGAQIDTAARQPLWNAGLDYAHGTGHGVGCFLAVHEEAASISPRGKVPLEAGMLLSNEPGYYQNGSHGIRIENLVFVQKAGTCEATGAEMLCFETVTLAPIDQNLIISGLLTTQEKEWLNAYHIRVYKEISPFLQGDDISFLKQATAPIQ